MPLYEYQCTKCGHTFEVIQRFSDPPKKSCPRCKGKLRKLISAPAIQFKGSGWYVTDYGGRKGGGESEKKEKRAESSGSDKPAAKPAEAPAKEKGKDPDKKGKE